MRDDGLRLGEHRLQRRILNEDGVLELPKCAAWLDAQLFCQVMTGLAVDIKPVGLAAGPVEGEHQLPMQPFPERIRLHQRF